MKDGNVLVDTPGIGGSGEVTEKLLEYIPNAVAFIFVIDVSSAGGLQRDRVNLNWIYINILFLSLRKTLILYIIFIKISCFLFVWSAFLNSENGFRPTFIYVKNVFKYQIRVSRRRLVATFCKHKFLIVHGLCIQIWKTRSPKSDNFCEIEYLDKY